MNFAVEILDCLENGRSEKKYSENIRQFCIALSYYSPNAYRHVRSVFQNHLPDPRTMRMWMSSIDSSPGITAQSLITLEQKAKEYKANGKKLFIALMADEMSIRKQVAWHEKIGKFSGFVTCRDNEHENQNEELPIAKNALVFMAVGDEFKITVAYFLLTGLNTLGRAALTQLVIESVNATGVQVITFTQDGLRANVSVMKELGVDFVNNKPYFSSPTNPADKIYCIWDPPHMLKLFRGCLKHHQLYYDDKPIHWNFIKNLHEMQKQRNINLGNKLTDKHLNFHVMPMNVRMACETMSNSVADGIDQLRNDGYEEFEGSRETTELIRAVNNTFDILNFKPNMNGAGNHFKKPLNPSTANAMFEYSARMISYFKSIEIDESSTRTVKDKNGKKEKQTRTCRKLAIKSRNFMPFLGFVTNLTALEGIYKDFVLNGPLESLYTFQFFQDHLETWFSCVRRGFGK